ncbi:metallophosphoesterase family protein [Chloroflexota bacterium]
MNRQRIFFLLIFCLSLSLLTACESPLNQLTKTPTKAEFTTNTPVSTQAPATFPSTIEASNTPETGPSVTPLPSATETPLAVRFAVIGDYGEGSQAEQDVADLVKSWNPDLIITTGDNNYPDGAAETIDDRIGKYYHEYIHPYQGAFGEGAEKNRFFPTLGNHDYTTANAQPYFDYFTLPGNERYYDFVWGPVHFFAIDADSREPDGVSRISIQATWLKDKLAVSDSTWNIVYFHQPPYSSGYHGSVEWMRWPFQEWGATAALGGHDHLYERFLIDGFTYFTNGLGGGPIYPFLIPLQGSQVRYNNDWGAMLVTADEEQITFQFITGKGEVIDKYQIVK